MNKRKIILGLLVLGFLSGSLFLSASPSSASALPLHVKQNLPLFAHPGETSEVDAYFLTDETGTFLKRPTIIIGEIFNSIDVIANVSAEAFLRQGYHALVVHNPNYPKIFRQISHLNELKSIRESFSLQHELNEKTLAFALTQPHIDTENLGVFGISFGGIMMSYLLSLHPEKFKAAFFALPGADFKDLFLNSFEPSIRNCRKRLFTELGSNGSKGALELYEKLSLMGDLPEVVALQRIPTDQLKNKTFILSAWFDMVVPRKNADELWQMLGEPKREFLPLGHYSTAAYFWGVRDKSVAWFKEKFSSQTSQLPTSEKI